MTGLFWTIVILLNIIFWGCGAGFLITKWLQRREAQQAWDEAFLPAAPAAFVAPVDELVDAMGDYANDPRIRCVGPNFVQLHDGRTITRTGRRHPWHQYRADGTPRFVTSWRDITDALDVAIGAPINSLAEKV